MADYITTYSKVHIVPLDPDPKDLRIEDIAHSLSLLCRANGHFPEFYSVAQHCLDCCSEAKAQGYSVRIQLACLLHDAAEAYLSDVTRPVKKDLPRFVENEERLLSLIYETFLGSDLTEEEQRQVKCVDDSLLYYEFDHYMGEKLGHEHFVLKSEPRFTFVPFTEVELAYMETFYALQNVLD